MGGVLESVAEKLNAAERLLGTTNMRLSCLLSACCFSSLYRTEAAISVTVRRCGLSSTVLETRPFKFKRVCRILSRDRVLIVQKSRSVHGIALSTREMANVIPVRHDTGIILRRILVQASN